MLRKKQLLVILLAICGLSGLAQESKTFKLYGFVRSDFYSDSRKINASTQDLFSLYPLYKDLNNNGEDLNATPSAGLMSITTRMGLDFESPAGILGANKAVAKIETDFGGAPTYMILRIRQAYTQIIWDQSKLLIGQTWHPLFAQVTQPNVLSLNTGALFQPFNRSPQIRYDYQLDKIQLTAAAIYQMMYATQGPDETAPTKNAASVSYQKNAMVPDLYVGLEYKKNKMLVGLGADYKSIMPTRYITDNNGMKHINHNLLSTPAAMIYGVYTDGDLTVKAKVLYGQNLTEHTIIGGFAITTPIRNIFHTTVLLLLYTSITARPINLVCWPVFRPTWDPPKPFLWEVTFTVLAWSNANTNDEKIVGNLFRLTPTYSYNTGNWRMGVELEYTNAAWGKRSLNNGKILNLDHTEKLQNLCNFECISSKIVIHNRRGGVNIVLTAPFFF